MKSLRYFMVLSLFTAGFFIIADAQEQHSTSGKAKVYDAAEKVSPVLVGTKIPDVTVHDINKKPVNLTERIMQKPTVLVFYRGGWCPYCNRQLAELKNIEQPLVELGYQILAVSPQTPAALQEQKLETEQVVTLLSDASLATITGFGVGYHVDMMTSAKYKTYGIALTNDTEGNPVLPAPAIFFVDQKGTVLASYVNPDYTVRPSAQLVLAMATALAGK